MTVDLDLRIESHLVDAVRTSKAEIHPFPHAVIPGIFPSDVYEELLHFLPSNDHYEPFSYGKHHSADGRSNRLRFGLHNDSLNRLTDAQRSFWCTLRGALGSVRFKQAVYDKLKAGLAFRFGVEESAVSNIDGYALPELFRELSSYRIAPHPDTRRKVVTMQISLPRDNSQSELGTEFYRRSLNPLHLIREPRGFEVVKCTPYLPNTAYCFSVLNSLTWRSWHGRSTLPSDCGVRNSILNIWYLNAADGNLDIINDRAKRAA